MYGFYGDLCMDILIKTIDLFIDILIKTSGVCMDILFETLYFSMGSNALH